MTEYKQVKMVLWVKYVHTAHNYNIINGNLGSIFWPKANGNGQEY